MLLACKHRVHLVRVLVLIQVYLSLDCVFSVSKDSSKTSTGLKQNKTKQNTHTHNMKNEHKGAVILWVNVFRISNFYRSNHFGVRTENL